MNTLRGNQVRNTGQMIHQGEATPSASHLSLPSLLLIPICGDKTIAHDHIRLEMNEQLQSPG